MYEYDAVHVSDALNQMRRKFFERNAAILAAYCNARARDGWRLHPATDMTDILVFERKTS